MASEEEDLKDSAAAPVEKKEVVITECPVQSVVVYADRAEVRDIS